MTDQQKTRSIGGLTWTAAIGDDVWTTCGWALAKHSRQDGHVTRTGWYLSDAAATIVAWAGNRMPGALKVASLLVAGQWERTGLAEPDGTVTWRNTATGEVLREPDLLATLDDDRSPGRHKYPPLFFRPGIGHGDPDGDRAWLMAYAEETGRPYGAILAEALALYRKQVEQAKALLSPGGQGTVRRP